MKKAGRYKDRQEMVSRQILCRRIKDSAVIDAFLEVPRHLFVPNSESKNSYSDSPLPIGRGQTISQPYIAALMTESLGLAPGQKVLEVGTGSGYQAAILACLGAQVYSIERYAFLAKAAENRLLSLGCKVKIKIGDGSEGWQQEAPFDRIIVTAAMPALPQALLDQLTLGGRLVVPLEAESGGQELILAEKISPKEIKKKRLCACIFVPLIGRYGYKE
ncbi:MAG: protein-L-isoaspartate(D-aspartate) O-methyltransferase [Candidatus Omnitrophica bacterium]|nr:protein-L-isoaspartate(D-aspartate) O-methyltransferase [Candidatus Omnitrophota bacterium]MDD5429370.1 protein-L-isoaspartate(D-aspartate) O-methyltransferase [Candidatus Omnitrophota bacterium]